MFRIVGLDPQEDLPTRKNFRQPALIRLFEVQYYKNRFN
jgi:hypothetical protein